MGKCNDLESAAEFINRHKPLVVPFDNDVCPGLTSDHDQRGLKLKPTIYGSSPSTSSEMLIKYVYVGCTYCHHYIFYCIDLDYYIQIALT